jgi:hypothetical protein
VGGPCGGDGAAGVAARSRSSKTPDRAMNATAPARNNPPVVQRSPRPVPADARSGRATPAPVPAAAWRIVMPAAKAKTMLQMRSGCGDQMEIPHPPPGPRAARSDQYDSGVAANPADSSEGRYTEPFLRRRAVVAVQLVTGLEDAMHPLSATRPPGRSPGAGKCRRDGVRAGGSGLRTDPGRGGAAVPASAIGLCHPVGECAAGPAVAFTTATGLRVLTSGALYQPAPPAPIAGKSRALVGPAVRLPVA